MPAHLNKTINYAKSRFYAIRNPLATPNVNNLAYR